LLCPFLWGDNWELVEVLDEVLGDMLDEGM
jgi:hypothetical protein